jgi:hypothetical protein
VIFPTAKYLAASDETKKPRPCKKARGFESAGVFARLRSIRCRLLCCGGRRGGAVPIPHTGEENTPKPRGGSQNDLLRTGFQKKNSRCLGGPNSLNTQDFHTKWTFSRKWRCRNDCFLSFRLPLFAWMAIDGLLEEVKISRMFIQRKCKAGMKYTYSHFFPN